jgi:hypothetical protein
MTPKKEKIQGGLASGKSEESFPPKKVRAGAKVEREHTPDTQIAKEIAMDHLTEDPRYYDKLKKIEKMAYWAGRADAFAKFSAASSAAPADASSVRDSGSPVATTHHRDSAQNIAQNFRYNSTVLTDPSSFTQPSRVNNTLQGGPPTKPFQSDTTGGLRDS